MKCNGEKDGTVTTLIVLEWNAAVLYFLSVVILVLVHGCHRTYLFSHFFIIFDFLLASLSVV